MRTIMALGIAVALIAVGTLAAATTRTQTQSPVTGPGINPFELMVNSNDLPAPQYGEPF